MGRQKRSLKRNQRKIDTTDVEDLLVKQREEALLGGAVEKRQDSSIFQVDKPVQKPVSRKKVFREKVLSVDKALLPNPHVSVAKKISSKVATTTISSAAVAKYERSRLPQSVKNTTNFYDVWNTPDDVPDPEDFAEDGKKFKRRPQPPPIFTPSAMPAVIIAPPGNSYNPDYEDHQTVLGEAVAQEIKRVALKKKMEDTLKVRKRKLIKTEEMQASAVENAEIAEDESSEDKADLFILPEPKTRQDRAKEARKLLFSEQMKAKENKKRRRKELDTAESIVKELDSLDELHDAKRQLKKQQLAELPPAPRPIGTFEFKEGPMEVLLSDEMPRKMRSLPKVGNPMNDQYNHYLRRNMLAVSNKKGSRKPEYKTIILA